MSVHYLEDTASAMFSAQIAALASGRYFCVRSAWRVAAQMTR
jgi:hypothetical protein